MANAFSLYLEDVLSDLDSKGLRRKLLSLPSKCISFCDNDYLGLRSDERLKNAALKHNVGAGASRLVAGNNDLYQALESKLAQTKSTESALVFTSGFSMNIGVISALASKGDLIIADKLCHASLIDGAMASGADFIRYAHNDLDNLKLKLQKRDKYRHVFIVTESVFSMDGDKSPVEDILEISELYDCQAIIDDAHGFGLSDPLPKHDRIIHLGTLSKSVGCLGGYVCGSKALIDYLTNKCRSLIYTTALPPMTLAAAIESLTIIQKEPELGVKAIENAALFCSELSLPAPVSAIVPLIVGDELKAVNLTERLQGEGFYVVAIRPPTVPVGTARLRFTFSARHTRQQVDSLITAVKKVLQS